MKITLVSTSKSSLVSESAKKPSLTSWFDKLSKEAQEEYLEEHPNSIYAKHSLRKANHKARKSRTGSMAENLDPRFAEASKGLDPNLLKEVSKLDEDLQQAFTEHFSGYIDELMLDFDSEQTDDALKGRKARAIKAKKEADSSTDPRSKKKATQEFKRAFADYKELKLAQQKAQDIMKTPGKLEKFKNELGRKLLSKMSKVQANTSV
jgi:hypothetical protein